MKKIISSQMLFFSAVIVAIVAAPAIAQRRSSTTVDSSSSNRGMMRYDRSTEATVKGTVSDVNQHQRGMRSGTDQTSSTRSTTQPSTSTTPSSSTSTTGATAGAGEAPDFTVITLQTDAGTSMHIILGPTDYLSQRNFNVSKGDQLEVTGSKVSGQQAGGDTMIAREAKKGSETLTLRDAEGRPEWSSSRQRPQRP